MKFSRPETAYIHDLQPTKGSYVKISSNPNSQQSRMKERMAMISEKKMWFERAELLIKTVDYVKKAAMNVEAMCNTFYAICASLSTINNKLKIYNEVNEFIQMYMTHELPYAMFEIYSCDAFESFVVRIIV